MTTILRLDCSPSGEASFNRKLGDEAMTLLLAVTPRPSWPTRWPKYPTIRYSSSRISPSKNDISKTKHSSTFLNIPGRKRLGAVYLKFIESPSQV